MYNFVVHFIFVCHIVTNKILIFHSLILHVHYFRQALEDIAKQLSAIKTILFGSGGSVLHLVHNQLVII